MKFLSKKEKRRKTKALLKLSFNRPAKTKFQQGELQAHRGFSLIEMMAAISLFLVVVTVSVGSVLIVIDAGRKAQSVHLVMSNMNFVLEHMTRTIRVGDTYHCGTNGTWTDPRDCNSGQPFFVFEPFGGNRIFDDDQVIYSLKSGHIERYRNVSTPVPLVLTAPEITVDKLEFFVANSDPPPTTGNGPDQEQPHVTIVVQGHANTGNTQTNFNLQTTVTQRVFDVIPF